MRCLTPAPLRHQLGLAVLLACGKPLRNIACMQSSGHVACVVRVWGWAWVMLQRGLVCLHHQDFLPKSLSTHEALFFRCRRDISEAHFRAFWREALPGMPAMLGPRSINTVKSCCAERWAVVLLLLWLAHALRGPCFFPLVSGLLASARDPSHKNAAIYGVLLRLCFQAGLRAAPGWGPESWHPRHHLGLGRATRIT